MSKQVQSKHKSQRKRRLHLHWVSRPSTITLTDGTVLNNSLCSNDHNETISLKSFLNVSKLDSNSKYTTKLNNFLDNSHKRTPYTTWYHSLKCMPEDSQQMRHVWKKSLTVLQRRCITFLQTHYLWSDEIEASIVAFYVCCQMSVGFRTHPLKDHPLLLFLSLSYDRFHYYRLSDIQRVVSPKNNMTLVSHLQMIHRGGNFYLDLITMCEDNKINTKKIWMIKMIGSVDLFVDSRHGNNDWIIKNWDLIDVILNDYNLVIKDLKKYNWLQMVTTWLHRQKLKIKPCMSPDFDDLYRSHLNYYQHLNEFPYKCVKSEKGRWKVLRHVDFVNGRYRKFKYGHFDGKYLSNSILGKHLHPCAKEAVKELAEQFCHTLTESMCDTVADNVSLYKWDFKDDDRNSFCGIKNDVILSKIFGIFADWEQFLLCLISDIFSWIWQPQYLHEEYFILQIFMSIDVEMWTYLYRCIKSYLDTMKSINMIEPFYPCTFATIREWSLSVLCNPGKSVHYVPDWQLNCGILRQHLASTTSKTYLAFKFFNLLSCIYNYGPLQGDNNDIDEFQTKVEIALGDEWDHFKKEYITTFKNGKWQASSMFHPSSWDFEVMNVKWETPRIPRDEPYLLPGDEHLIHESLEFLSSRDDCKNDQVGKDWETPQSPNVWQLPQPEQKQSKQKTPKKKHQRKNNKEKTPQKKHQTKNIKEKTPKQQRKNTKQKK